jgi:hypothetical protein
MPIVDTESCRSNMYDITKAPSHRQIGDRIICREQISVHCFDSVTDTFRTRSRERSIADRRIKGGSIQC